MLCWLLVRFSRKRVRDGNEKYSSKDISYCCENPEKRTLSETVEPKDTSTLIPEKPRRSGKLEARKVVHRDDVHRTSTSITCIWGIKTKNLHRPYWPDPELARKYCCFINIR